MCQTVGQEMKEEEDSVVLKTVWIPELEEYTENSKERLIKASSNSNNNRNILRKNGKTTRKIY